MTPRDPDTLPVLSQHLREERAVHPPLTADLAALLGELALAGKLIARELARAGLTGRLGETGEVNVQGERVKQLDAWANRALVEVLGRSGLACTLISEEMAAPLHRPAACHAGGYLVCFDPVDGSLNTDVNGIAGTIFGIRARGSRQGAARTVTRRPSPRGLPRDHADAALAPGTTQVAAGYLLYGPATVLVYTAGHGVHGLTLDTTAGEYRLSHPDVRMPRRGATYSVNEANSTRWTAPARAFVESLRADGSPYSLRYGGALAADFHRTLLEGGVYLYPAEVQRPQGKLRLLYEAAPLALVAEQAGGRASTGVARVLDLVATGYHQRVPLFIGSAHEVARAEACHRTAATPARPGSPA